MKEITGEIAFEDMTSRNVLEKKNVQVLGSSTTPDVLNKQFFIANNTVVVNVTDFLNGAPGQRIYILGDGFTTLTHGTRIFTNTAAAKVLASNAVYRFTYYKLTPTTHIWVEDAGGSSGGGGLPSAHSFRHAGYVNITSTTYVAVDTAMDLVIAAAIGDKIAVSVAGIYNNSAGQMQLDVITLVGGAAVNYISSSTATGFGIQGCRGLPVSQATTFGATIFYTVQAGDISGGNVTLRVVAKVASSNRQIAATSDEPFSFGAVNYRQ